MNSHKLVTISLVIVAAAVLLAVGYRLFGPLPEQTALNVPYISQVPDGQWVAPWDEACEEAAISMVEAYYRGEDSISPAVSKNDMLDMFAWENQVLKKNFDTDATETLKLIQSQTTFLASIKRNPSLQEIKREIAAGHPVIFLHNMYQLYGEQDLGDSYHVSVITGYDDAKSQFTIHDPARESKQYSYDALMNSLHDFNPQSREADGPPTVLFTSQP